MFRKMADIYNCQVGFWQRRFMGELFKTVFSLRGRINFTNLARFSPFHEQTFRRHFQKAFRWVWFNLTVFRLRRHPKEPTGGVFDCSFMPKSGTETWGLDQFFSSLAGRSKQGLEVSVLGVVATESRRAFGVDATQTPPDLSTDHTGGYSRVDFYLEQITDLYDQIADLGVSYWVTGGFYAKQKVFDTVTGLGGDLITRLRSDANLRHLYTGPPRKGPGRPKQYDGKIDWDDQETLTRRFDEVGRLPDQPEVRVLTAVANSPHFGPVFYPQVLVAPKTPISDDLAPDQTSRTGFFCVTATFRLADRLAKPVLAAVKGVNSGKSASVGTAATGILSRAPSFWGVGDLWVKDSPSGWGFFVLIFRLGLTGL